MACALLLLGGSLFFPAAAFPQNEDSAPKVIQVGIVVAPPLCIKTADGGYEGFSVELWETVARHLKLPYAFREFSTLESLFDALEKGEIDVIPSMPVQERFAATIFIASFTADITTSLTVSELRGRVRGLNDLYHTRVGSIPRTEAFDFLTKQGIAATPFAGIREGVAAVADKKIDAFVLNEQVLKYITKSEFPGRVQVLPRTYDEYFLSMALVDKSQLRKPINNALLKLMKTRDWAEMLNRYAQ
jgi:ABC-type amino acid transport substrate-binding protein